MKFALATLAAATFAWGTPDSTTEYDITSMGKFKVSNAAFPMMGKFDDTDDFLIVSSFGALSSGHVYIVPDVADYITNNDVKNADVYKLKVKSFEWPNEVKAVPSDVFEGKRAIVVPDGFLVPGKSNGGVYIIEIDPTDVTKALNRYTLSKKKGYYHHMGFWVDLNGDGRKDFLTARSNTKAGQGELLWLEHPEGGFETENWTEHVLGNVADVGIDMVEMSHYKNEVVVFCAQFFDQVLSVSRISTKDGSLVSTRVIDDSTILDVYLAQYVDINGDGTMELLVNNHEKDDSTNGVFQYTVPKDLDKGTFTKTTLADGFENAFSLTVPNMSPGFPYAVWPKVSEWGKGDSTIMVAGDGDYTWHVMTPDADSDTVYGDYFTKNEKGTVGALAYADLDNDGWLEVFVPNYDKSYIEVFKFSPLTTTDEVEQIIQ